MVGLGKMSPYLVAYEYPVLFNLLHSCCSVRLFSCFSAGWDTSPELAGGVADSAEGNTIRLAAFLVLRVRVKR